MLNLPRNIWVMSLVMALSFSSTAMMVLIAGLIGAQLAPSASLATLPYAVVVIGTACASIPAAMIMSRIGRKRGVYVGLAVAMCATLLALLAVVLREFWLFVFAAFLIGMNAAFTQQGRFIILENAADAQQQADGLTLALLANLIAAFLGPWMGLAGKDLSVLQHITSAEYSGAFILLFGLLVLASLILSRYEEQPMRIFDQQNSGRSIFSIIRQQSFVLAAGSAAFGFAIMAFVMTATPVSMHQLHGHALSDTTWVIQSHIVAMFLPSLITGRLIKAGFNTSLLLIGFTIYLGMVGIAFNGQHVMHYWWALVLLGLGWNFIFMTSTTRLASAHDDNEKFKTQAANDFLVFSFQAIAAFSAGFVLFEYGWITVVQIALVMSMVWLLVLIGTSTFTRSKPKPAQS